MPEFFISDLVNLLLFTMPGFFFLRALGYKTESDFAYFMYSMFWGVLLMVFAYNKFFSLEKMVPMIENPYAGAVIFSILAGCIGIAIRMLKPRFPIEF